MVSCNACPWFANACPCCDGELVNTSAPKGWDVVDTSTPGQQTPSNKGSEPGPATGRSPAPMMLTCCLCGQRYDAQSGPCGCGKPWADHIGPCVISFTCTLCGQRIDDGLPCGCGARPTRPAPLRRMTHKEVDAFMEGTAVLIPVKILKEWRRGLMTIDGEELTLFMIDHAQEIKAEIEEYLR